LRGESSGGGLKIKLYEVVRKMMGILTAETTASMMPPMMESVSVVVTAKMVMSVMESIYGWMGSNSLIDNLGLEASMRGGDVVDGSQDPIGLYQAVGSLGHGTVTDLNGVLVVPGKLV